MSSADSLPPTDSGLRHRILFLEKTASPGTNGKRKHGTQDLRRATVAAGGPPAGDASCGKILQDLSEACMYAVPTRNATRSCVCAERFYAPVWLPTRQELSKPRNWPFFVSSAVFSITRVPSCVIPLILLPLRVVALPAFRHTTGHAQRNDHAVARGNTCSLNRNSAREDTLGRQGGGKGGGEAILDMG